MIDPDPLQRFDTPAVLARVEEIVDEARSPRSAEGSGARIGSAGSALARRRCGPRPVRRRRQLGTSKVHIDRDPGADSPGPFGTLGAPSQRIRAAAARARSIGTWNAKVPGAAPTARPPASGLLARGSCESDAVRGHERQICTVQHVARTKSANLVSPGDAKGELAR